MDQRNHRAYDKMQFWLTVAGFALTILSSTGVILWNMSGRLTAIESNIVRIETRMDTGFKHIARAITGLDSEKTIFQSKIEEVYKRCCSEITASSSPHGASE